VYTITYFITTELSSPHKNGLPNRFNALSTHINIYLALPDCSV